MNSINSNNSLSNNQQYEIVKEILSFLPENERNIAHIPVIENVGRAVVQVQACETIKQMKKSSSSAELLQVQFKGLNEKGPEDLTKEERVQLVALQKVFFRDELRRTSPITA